MNEDEIIEALYLGIPLSKLELSDDIINEYKTFMEILELPSLDYNQDWLMPDSYKNMDIIQYLLSLCKNDNEKIRVLEELLLFEKSGNIMLVKYIKYLTDIIKKNDIVIGTGRGSSCSLYCLYLLGLHKVDSIKYKLNYNDYFKEI